MHGELNLLFHKGPRRVQLLFSWYLFFGFKVNKFFKALGQALFLHLNMRQKILKIFISFIFNAPISLKRGLECANWPLKLSNLIACFCWRQRVDNLVFWVEPQSILHSLKNYAQMKGKFDCFPEWLALLYKVYQFF